MGYPRSMVVFLLEHNGARYHRETYPSGACALELVGGAERSRVYSALAELDAALAAGDIEWLPAAPVFDLCARCGALAALGSHGLARCVPKIITEIARQLARRAEEL